MSCSSCAQRKNSGETGDLDTPGGCRNHGHCSSGGCNKLEVYDWLANITLPSGTRPYDIVEIRFKNSRKGFYRNSTALELFEGDIVVVDTAPGYDIGVISVSGELARLQVKKKQPDFKPVEAKKIIRKATREDIEKWQVYRKTEENLMHRTRQLALKHQLSMKISDVEYQGDGSKATFYYTAEDRVDFRQLIKSMAEEFRIRVEMRQIGVRQEAGRLGSIGSCGRELCCSTWLTDFRTVSTNAARYQQLSINPQKLAGQCGKLKCCLNFELDQYTEALKDFPDHSQRLETEKGRAIHMKNDIFRRLMWYVYEDQMGGDFVPVPVERVSEILKLNKNNQKPSDLLEGQWIKQEPRKIDFSKVDAQDDLTRFDDSFKKKKKKKKNKNRGQQPNPQNQTNTQKQEPKSPGQQPGRSSVNRNSNRNRNNNRNPNPNKPKP